jgi:hypothetical protein
MGQSSDIFLRTASRNHYDITVLVDCLDLWIEFKVNSTLDIEERDATHKDFFIASESIAQVSLASFPNFTQNLMLIRCSKNRSPFFATRRRNMHTSYQRRNLYTTGVDELKL